MSCRVNHTLHTGWVIVCMFVFVPLVTAQPQAADLSIGGDAITMQADLPDVPPSRPDERPPVVFSATIHNVGFDVAESVEVMFVAVSVRADSISRQTIARIEAESYQTTRFRWLPTLDAAEIVVRLDASGQIPELSEINNVASRRFVFNTFRLTPERGSNGLLSSWDGHLTLNIPSGIVKTETVVAIESLLSLPDMSHQPALRYVSVSSKPRGAAYRISFPDTVEAGISVDEHVPMDGVIHYERLPDEDMTQDHVGVYQWDEDEQNWSREGVQIQSVETHCVSFRAHQAGIFSALINSDQVPPTISLNVVDRQLRHDTQFASTQPTLGVLVEDDNGVGTIDVRLNGSLVSPEAFNRFDVLNHHKAVAIEFRPTLDTGEHVLQVTAADLAENRITEILSFRVGSNRGGIKAVANRPNPFSSETWFTYVLTEGVQAVRLRIYNTSGRLIYVVPEPPHDLGYNEIRWTGIDDDGEAIANGVYFYRITAIVADGRKITQTHKLVVRR